MNGANSFIVHKQSPIPHTTTEGNSVTEIDGNVAPNLFSTASIHSLANTAEPLGLRCVTHQ